MLYRRLPVCAAATVHADRIKNLSSLTQANSGWQQTLLKTRVGDRDKVFAIRESIVLTIPKPKRARSFFPGFPGHAGISLAPLSATSLLHCTPYAPAPSQVAREDRWVQRFVQVRSEEHTSELQSLRHLVCRLLLETKQNTSELQSLRHLVCRLLLETKKRTTQIQSPSHVLYSLLLG